MNDINSFFPIEGSQGVGASRLSPSRQFPIESSGNPSIKAFELPKPIEKAHSLDSARGVSNEPETWGHMVQQMVKDVNQAQKNAGYKIRDVLSGGSTTVHEAMIASQKSGVAFRVLAEVRNKALETYKEIIKIQV
ncbi:MAG: flagellar hook-basal body complex protein FliE [Verrucomicrobiota bacterium]